jgi:hypothetical protein
MGESELFSGQAHPGHFGLVCRDGLEFPGRVETIDITIKDQTRVLVVVVQVPYPSVGLPVPVPTVKDSDR